MPKTNRLSGYLDETHLEFVEREATPRLLMDLRIHFHLADLSISNIISILDISGVEPARPTVHNCVHKADLQPEDGRNPNHVAIDETVIQPDNERYWLYAAVDPETNDLLHTTLEPTRTNVLEHGLSADLCERHDVNDAVFLVDDATPLKDACCRHDLEFRYEKHEARNSVQRIFCEVKRRTSSFSNCFGNADAETADQWLRSFAFAWNQLI